MENKYRFETLTFDKLWELMVGILDTYNHDGTHSLNIKALPKDIWVSEKYPLWVHEYNWFVNIGSFIRFMIEEDDIEWYHNVVSDKRSVYYHDLYMASKFSYWKLFSGH